MACLSKPLISLSCGVLIMSESKINKQSSKKVKGISRRRFLTDMAGTACGVGILSSMIGLYSTSANALHSQAIRPPGALDETDFLSSCTRCGICVQDCPYDILKLAQMGDKVPLGTPYFTARTGPCEMCEDVPCVVNCPTGALDNTLVDINKAKMGLAVVVDHETCIAFLGLRCEVCFNVCPLRGDAISLDYRHNVRSGRHALFIPVVNSDACTGCGLCERACILEDAPAIKVFPTHLAKGDLGHHYRVGWDQQKAAGGSLIQVEDKHEYNLPEGVVYDYEGVGLITDEGGNPIVDKSLISPEVQSPLDALNMGIVEDK